MLIFLIKFDPAACDAASAAVASALSLALAPLPRGKAAGVKGFAWIIKVRASIVPNDEFVCQNCRGRRRFGARKVAAVEINLFLRRCQVCASWDTQNQQHLQPWAQILVVVLQVPGKVHDLIVYMCIQKNDAFVLKF